MFGATGFGAAPAPAHSGGLFGAPTPAHMPQQAGVAGMTTVDELALRRRWDDVCKTDDVEQGRALILESPHFMNGIIRHAGPTMFGAPGGQQIPNLNKNCFFEWAADNDAVGIMTLLREQGATVVQKKTSLEQLSGGFSHTPRGEYQPFTKALERRSWRAINLMLDWGQELPAAHSNPTLHGKAGILHNAAPPIVAFSVTMHAQEAQVLIDLLKAKVGGAEAAAPTPTQPTAAPFGGGGGGIFGGGLARPQQQRPPLLQIVGSIFGPPLTMADYTTRLAQNPAVQMGDMELVEFLHARGASTNVLGIPNTRDMPPINGGGGIFGAPRAANQPPPPAPISTLDVALSSLNFEMTAKLVEWGCRGTIPSASTHAALLASVTLMRDSAVRLATRLHQDGGNGHQAEIDKQLMEMNAKFIAAAIATLSATGNQGDLSAQAEEYMAQATVLDDAPVLASRPANLPAASAAAAPNAFTKAFGAGGGGLFGAAAAPIAPGFGAAAPAAGPGLLI
eukprot:gene18727-20545_t